jgi:hypothetical protein
MRNMLNGITLSVGKVIDRVDVPFIATPMMSQLLDSVDRGIPQVHIRTLHVDLGAEELGTFK